MMPVNLISAEIKPFEEVLKHLFFEVLVGFIAEIGGEIDDILAVALTRDEVRVTDYRRVRRLVTHIHPVDAVRDLTLQTD